jgi:hypothetical protein
MKKIVFVLLALQSLTAYSQFSDDFSDGRFLSGADVDRGVDWIGDNAEFIVNNSLQLQLYSDGNSSPSQLKTRSTIVENASWEFYVKMDFSPTSSNYAKVYIASDEENLTGELNGLFIRIGYTDKNICLISSEKEKNNKTLIKGLSKRLDFSSIALNIKATLDEKGNFKLYSQLEGESDFTLEGSFLLTDIPVSNWFGIVCNYTATRSKLVYFDDFIVKKLTEGEPGGDTDPSPNAELPQEGDILFSEIMANPASGNPEYVELYNTTSKTFQLKDCLYFYGDKSYTLPDKTIAPHSYFVLCKTTVTDWFDSNIQVFGVTSFPTLANTGKLLMFGNTAGELISWFEYSDKMYQDNDKKNGGWSLECIDLSNFSNTSLNWSAAVDVLGGTPGKENSVKANNPDLVSPKILSYATTGNQGLIVTFSKPMNRTTLSDKNSYTINNSTYQINNLQTNYPQGTELTILFNQLPPQGSFFEIELTGVKDLSENTLEDDLLLIGNGFQSNPNDIIINELLFNAPTGGNEYVEIYNRSSKVIDLRYLSITSRKPSDGSFNKLYPLTTLPLFLHPKEYLIITKNHDLVCEFFNCQEEAFFVELPVMPSIANASGCVVILNNQTNEIVDEFAYNEKMHSSEITNKKGVSLERISFEKPASDNNNWQSATAQSGYGTPGYINSQHVADDTGIGNNVYVEYPVIGIDGYKIKYQLNKAGYKCRIYVYDASGRMINTLLNNELLASEGEIYWNGKGSRNQKLVAGIYILYIELYDTNGNVQKIKLPTVVN